MFSNWLTLRALAECYHSMLCETSITEIFSQEKNELIITLSRGNFEFFLEFSAEPRFPYFILKPDFSRARKNSVDLLPTAIGRKIRSVAIAEDDRIMRLLFDDASALFVILFGARANVIHCDANGCELSQFKQKCTGLSLSHGFGNSFPSHLPKRMNYGFNTSESTTLEKKLRSIAPFLSGTLAVELQFRSDLYNCENPIRDFSAHTNSLAEKLEELLAEVNAQEYFVYIDSFVPTHFSLCRLHHLGQAEVRSFTDIHEALFFFLRKRRHGESISGCKAVILKAMQKELERQHSALEKLITPETIKKQADDYEKFGNLLMIHVHDKPEQPNRITVPDLFIDPRIVISIPLQERKSLVENSQRYFEKARNAKDSIDHVIKRKRMITRRIEQLRESIEQFSAAIESKHIKDLSQHYKELMASLGLTQKGEKNTKPFPFRRFVVVGGFEVWVGKNSANNDELTVRHAKPNDIWFHARGVGGSHTIIRVSSAEGQPGKETIRAAASIAAYFSKYRKAKSVPVAYTEKKYVHKPKGVPPGTVTLEREKVIMVDPKLPENQIDDSSDSDIE